MCEPNTDIEPQTTDIEAGEKMQESVDKEVDTFTGDELGFEVVDMSAGEDVDVANKEVEVVAKSGEDVKDKGVEEVKDEVGENSEEKGVETVEVAMEEEADFGDAEVVEMTDAEPAPLSPKDTSTLQPRKDLIQVNPDHISESETQKPAPIFNPPRAKSALKQRGKSRTRTREIEKRPAPKRAPSRPAPQQRGRSGAPPERTPIKPLSPNSRSKRGPREVTDDMSHLSITPPLSATISKTAFLAEMARDNPITGWAAINLHVAAYYYEEGWKWAITHPKQLAATALRRDASLQNRWLCWACQHPNPDAPQRTGKTSFKSSMDVSYHWWPAHATDAQSKWLDLAIHHKVTLADILQMYGINLNEQPWPVGSALAELPTFIPSRSTPHDARLFKDPYWRKKCDTRCPSEQGLPWNETSLVTYSGTYPQTSAQDWQQSTTSEAPMSPDKGLSDKILNRRQQNKERAAMAKDRGLELFPNAEASDEADVTFLGWIDPLDVFYRPLRDDLQQLCAGACSVPDYGASRKAWHLRNFGDSTLALELLRLEEHAFYILVFKMAATKAALSPNIFSADHRQLALTGSGWCSKTMDKLLQCFLNAEKISRPLSKNASFKDVVDYILECCRTSIPLYAQGAPKPPGREGKMTKKEQAVLLL